MVSDVSLGKSIHQLSIAAPLRRISVLDSSLSVKVKELEPSSMDSNAGRSIQSLSPQSITLEHNTRAALESKIADLE